MKESRRPKTTCRIAHHKWQVAAIAMFAIMLMPGSGWSWGRIGHRVAAEMAETRLGPRALAAIHELLGPGVTLSDISTWADDLRDVEGIGGPWHYVDVPITETRYDSKFCQPEG